MRALAVLAVVLYHADLGPFRGGYVGVDVFFVVSGALITGLLVDEVNRTGRISLPGFWSRRVRRLLPMSMLVVAVTIVGARVMVDPLTQGFIDRAGLAGIGFVANILFWSRGGYSHLAVPDPLVHFWSLAVEEQFYLVWPLLLWLLARSKLPFVRILAVAIAILGLASLAACVVLTSTRQTFAFYWLPTRAWELLTGAGLVVARPLLAPLPNVVRSLLAWVGLSAIVVCMVTFGDPEAGFPGWNATLPVLGTAFVLIGALQRGANPGRLLAGPMFVWVGKRSYSLYLWHLPILVLAAAKWGPLAVTQRIAAVAVAVGAATITFAVIENPVRRSPWLAARPRRSLAMGTSLAVVAAAVVFVTMQTRSSANTGVLAAAPILVTAPTSAAASDPAGSPAPTTRPSSVPSVDASASTTQPGTTQTSAAQPSTTQTSAATNATNAPTTTSVTAIEASPPTTASIGTSLAPPTTDALATLAALNRPTLDAAVRNQVVPANLTPAIGAAYRDKPVIYADGCILGDNSSTPGQCVFGVPNAAVTVVLFGDSHAAQWFSAMNAAALHNGWRLVVLTKMGCPTADVGVTNVVRRPECGPWRTNAIARIAALHPDLVVLSAYRYKGSNDTTWRAGLDRTLGALRPDATRVLVLGDTPTPSGDVPSCVAGHARSLDACVTTRTAAIRPGRLRAEASVAAAHNADFVSTDDWLCTDASCPVVIGDVLVYRDDSHLTDTAATFLTPYVEAMIRPLVPAP